MKQQEFRIYAGVTNLHNGAEYKGSFKFESLGEATEYARDEAIAEYQKYEGTAYKSLEDIAEENDIDTDKGYDEAMGLYLEEIDSWIEYWAE